MRDSSRFRKLTKERIELVVRRAMAGSVLGRDFDFQLACPGRVLASRPCLRVTVQHEARMAAT